ncbi:hypothetical protein [uncultured Croceitalea sp.]|uniref:hypothetical protein n=1 Tax=uncultured Croceitalea sp. TaxID=1798908 RepID=UPI00374F4E8C
MVFDMIHPDDKKDLKNEIKEVFANHSIWNQKFRVIVENSVIQWYLDKVVP